MTPEARWSFWIDRGGTFTDCLGRVPATGAVRAVKVLSSDRAPLEGIRALRGLGPADPIPPCRVRLGTTLATNALLERRGARVALVITRGFLDLLEIGDQTRPDLFALDIVKPERIYDDVLEVDARLDASGRVLARPDPVQVRRDLAALRGRGISSVAVVVLHSYREKGLEAEIGALAREAGFSHVYLSSETPEIGLLGRAGTTVVDAYLTPLLAAYVEGLRRELPGSALRLMQSSGGLSDATRFRGRNAVFSGPAAGVVAAAHVAERCGASPALGFDMGGTSTDVSCLEDRPERIYETEVAGVVLRAPMMAIHSVASGGGSLCRYTGTRFTVGPESAGAVPGPLCYGHEAARELTITDVNLFLGRLAGDRFPFPLVREPVDRALLDLARRAGMTPERAAAGFLAVADADMAEAIRRVTVGRGRDVREYALVVFGGAAGQHACAVARELGVRRLLVDRQAGVLSALGMGLAGITWEGESDAGRHAVDHRLPAHLGPLWAALESEARRVMAAEGFGEERTALTRRLGLRFRGSDTVITVDASGGLADWEAAFRREHRRHFGYDRSDAVIEATVARVEASGREEPLVERHEEAPPRPAPSPRETRPFWTGDEFVPAPVYFREDLAAGMELPGPALVLDTTSTLALDPGWRLFVRGDGRLEAKDATVLPAPEEVTAVDPVRLTIMNNLFYSIAAQMGETLRRTALSVNIRERRDYSSAVFDAAGDLVANAPHIPVHLGAMGESIRGVLAAHPLPAPGSVFATNDPAAGGSHLPDITVITPVHDMDGRLLFFTASRGHHADVGGTTPGSMPPVSSRLEEEGVVLRALPVVREGRFDEALVRRVLLDAPHPARCPDDNVADLAAQIAANQTGARLLGEAMTRLGRETVLAYMGHAQENAAAEVEAALRGLGDGVHAFEDAMDDGTRVRVTLTVAGGSVRVDFTGTGPESEGNLNAPRAVTVAAVLYVLRCLVGAPIPLNQGCLRPVTIHVPPGTLLSPAPGRAVAGGNVETSQRIVDVLLGALGLAAASQGTMNNVSFGTSDSAYYETVAGGAGATARRAGASGVHTHMTNTRITDPEVLESRFPVRLLEFSFRAGSGGAGRHRGGDGLIRTFEILAPLEVSVLSERRARAPFGLAGGSAGAPGRNLVNGQDVGGKAAFHVEAGDRVRIETPGGGGYGTPDS